MATWKENLAKFITGEATVSYGDEWVVRNKTNMFGGNWTLGQTGTCPYKFIINVQVNVPSGYTKEQSACEAGTLIYRNILKSHKNITEITLWDYNLLFGGQSESEVNAFIEELKSLKKATPDPEGEGIDYKLIACIALAAAAITFFIIKA